MIQPVVLSLILATFGLLVGCDKAKDGFHECEQLEVAGKLVEAVAACEAAHKADPETTNGISALSKAMDIQRKLDEIVPPTVTTEWCARLRDRLTKRLSDDARVKYGGAGGDIGTVIRDHALNVEYNCRQAAGKPTPGLWTCRWNETFDTEKQCDAMERR